MDRLILNIEKRPALEIIFSELDDPKNRNTQVIKSKYTFDHGPLRFLYRLHHSKKLNNLISIPGKRIWDRFCPLLKMQFNEGDEYYVAFVEIAALQYTIEELERLKACKNVHMCLILFNPMSGLMQENSPFYKMMKEFTFEKYFAIFDEEDIKTPGFNRLTAIYSSLNDEILQSSNLQDSDFFYIGMAKDRQELLQNIYEKIKESGKTADFTIVNPDPDIKKVEGINYLEEFMDYKEYLKHVNKTKCIVEVLQGNQHGMTLRTFEAMVYSKHLLTNNNAIEKVPFYSPKSMHYVSNFDDYDINSMDLLPLDKMYKGDFSPSNLLDQIKAAYAE